MDAGFELTVQDLCKLQAAQYDHLRSRVVMLQQISLMVDSGDRLLLICSSADEVAALKCLEPVLQHQIWEITGVLEFEVWLNSESVWHVEISPELLVIENDAIESNLMHEYWEIIMAPIAPVAEQQVESTPSVAQQPSTSAQMQLCKLETVVQSVADLTGKTTDNIEAEILEFNSVHSFEGMRLVPAGAGDLLIDRWAQAAKESLRAGAPASSKAASRTTPKVARTARTTTSLSNGKKGGGKRTKAPSLRLPTDFATQLSRDYSKTLGEILPRGEEKRKTYLDAIVNETRHGKSYIKRLAKAMTNKFKRLNPATTEKALMEAARQMAQGSNQPADTSEPIPA